MIIGESFLKPLNLFMIQYGSTFEKNQLKMSYFLIKYLNFDLYPLFL